MTNSDQFDFHTLFEYLVDEGVSQEVVYGLLDEQVADCEKDNHPLSADVWRAFKKMVLACRKREQNILSQQAR